MKFNTQSNLFIIGILIIFNLLIYANGFNNDFIGDGADLIQNNYTIRDFSNIKPLLTIEDSEANTPGTGFFRPFINMTYLVDYQLLGGRASSFRPTNIAFHVGSSIVLITKVL